MRFDEETYTKSAKTRAPVYASAGAHSIRCSRHQPCFSLDVRYRIFHHLSHYALRINAQLSQQNSACRKINAHGGRGDIRVYGTFTLQSALMGCLLRSVCICCFAVTSASPWQPQRSHLNQSLRSRPWQSCLCHMALCCNVCVIRVTSRSERVFDNLCA